jgi:RimJ/RimL family protein N-acetyltransferase
LIGFEPLLTPRLILRRLEPEDAALVQVYAGDRRVAHFTARIPHPYPDGAAAQWIGETHAQMERDAGWQLAIARRADEALIGAIGLEREEARNAAELGYWIAVPAWGRGYATEAARRLIRFGFEQARIDEIHAHALAENTASRRVLEKAGLAFQGFATVTLELRHTNARAACHAATRGTWKPDA